MRKHGIPIRFHFDTQDGTPIEATIYIRKTIKCPDQKQYLNVRAIFFMDWYMDIDGITRFDFETQIGDDITIFAKWRLPIGSNRSFQI